MDDAAKYAVYFVLIAAGAGLTAYIYVLIFICLLYNCA